VTDKRSALVVEDDAATAQYLSVVLTDAGFDVTVAVMAVEALNKLDDFSPHLIVTDVNMPGASGLTLLEHLRSKDSTQSTPVLVYTAASGDAVKDVAKQPYTKVLPKPARPKVIVETIERLLVASPG
jgi:CheY-like chemotaxis protein